MYPIMADGAPATSTGMPPSFSNTSWVGADDFATGLTLLGSSKKNEDAVVTDVIERSSAENPSPELRVDGADAAMPECISRSTSVSESASAAYESSEERKRV